MNEKKLKEATNRIKALEKALEPFAKLKTSRVIKYGKAPEMGAFIIYMHHIKKARQALKR